MNFVASQITADSIVRSADLTTSAPFGKHRTNQTSTFLIICRWIFFTKYRYIIIIQLQGGMGDRVNSCTICMGKVSDTHTCVYLWRTEWFVLCEWITVLCIIAISFHILYYIPLKGVRVKYYGMWINKSHLFNDKLWYLKWNARQKHKSCVCFMK